MQRRGQTVASSSGTEWHTYGHDAGGERFSPLKQINPANVDQLQRAWTYKVPAFPGGGVVAFESTPLMVDDVLYFAAPTGQAIALDAETGKQLWMFNPFSGVSQPPNPVPNRGVAYWRASGARSRILYVSADAHLYALDAATGKPCMDFGDGGSVNLRAGVATKWPQLRYDDTSPPVIYKDVVIVGSEVQEYPSIGPSGAVRAFDVRTGKLVWRFDTVPKPGEVGHDTWQGDDWKDRSGTNAWGLLSVDTKNGLVFLPLGSPTYDFYGADRKGKDLFGDSIVALNAATGKLVWYYQTVHHDLWDYDPSGQPVLLSVRRDGREIPAVAEVTKTGFVFVFDRLTGKPLFPIEERPVPPSELPGEASWPTQPYPVKPPPLATTSVTEADITTVTPESRQDCLQKFGAALPGRIFNPWGLKLKLEIPGNAGRRELVRRFVRSCVWLLVCQYEQCGIRRHDEGATGGFARSLCVGKPVGNLFSLLGRPSLSVPATALGNVERGGFEYGNHRVAIDVRSGGRARSERNSENRHLQSRRFDRDGWRAGFYRRHIRSSTAGV